MVAPVPSSARLNLPHVVAVGFRRINGMLQQLAPEFAARAHVSVLDVGFDQAVQRVRAVQAERGADVVVAAGSNGEYLRQHLDLPVVLVKVGGFDLLQALARARHLSERMGLVTYEGMAPDLAPFGELFGTHVAQRSYRTSEDAAEAVGELAAQGVEVVVGTGLVADLAEGAGLKGVFLYSLDAVREALEDALEVARAARIELAKRERLHALLGQLSDGVIAVDQHERVQTLNPAMAGWLGIAPGEWLGRRLSEVCPELSLQSALRGGMPELEKIEHVRGKPLIVNRMPIHEQGVLTGAVLSAQDPIRIQRVDRQIRTRIKPGASTARHELGDLLGVSAGMHAVRQAALSCARSEATVLLIGESGTGKELIAQGIHQAGHRRDMPFVAVNCAALSETLLESELFGYEDGAFTGARRGGREGLFEAAHNGTIFLDEIGEMPLPLQTRLLRVLQAREVLRVGATEPTPVNVRVIAATHRDLQAQVDRGLFRLDLFYRLNILRLHVPPLRERLEDVEPIAHALALRACRRAGLPLGVMHPLLAALAHASGAYAWPGNVRELENLVERLLAYAQGDPAIGETAGPTQADAFLRLHAPELFAPGPPAGDAARALLALAEGRAQAQQAEPAHPAQATLRTGKARAEREQILQVLTECSGDRHEASRRLGISRTTLWRKLKPTA